MYRIYFDANEGDEQDRFDLGIPGSLSDIEPIASELKNGMRVVLYDSEGMQVEALIESVRQPLSVLDGIPDMEHAQASGRRLIAQRTRPPA